MSEFSAIHRSPTYPHFDLRLAVQQARNIHRQHGEGKVDRLTLARSMGFTSLSGRASSSLATLKQFGFLSKRNGRQVGLTELAVECICTDSEDLRLVSRRKAAREPNLFQELEEVIGFDIPDPQKTTQYLRSIGFSSKAAKVAMSAYLGTIKFVGLYSGTEASSEPQNSQSGGFETPSEPVDTSMKQSQYEPGAHLSLADSLQPEEFENWMRIPLDLKTTIRIEVTRGQQIGVAPLEHLVSILNTTIYRMRGVEIHENHIG